jgi:excisionase family DNA binding protein
LGKLPESVFGHRLIDIAAATNVSDRTVRRAIAAGKIKLIDVGRARKLVPPEEAERLVREGLRQRAPGAGGKPRRRDIGAP